MAAGSQQFAWLRFPGVPHTCWRCGRENLRVKDVAVHRRKYPGGKDEFLCVLCSQERVQEAEDASRERLRLKPRSSP